MASASHDASVEALADEVDVDAAARGAVYAYFAETMDEPSAELHAAFESGEFEETLRDLLDRTNLDVSVPTLRTDDDYETLCARFNDLFELGQSQSVDRVNGVIETEGPPVPRYESKYREEVSWNDVNVDLARAYDYYGVAVDQECRRHHDHARLEIEFAGYLCRREAAAETEAARARLDFHRRHLSVLTGGMADRISEEGGTDVYGPLLSVLHDVVAADLEDLEGRVE